MKERGEKEEQDEEQEQERERERLQQAFERVGECAEAHGSTCR